MKREQIFQILFSLTVVTGLLSSCSKTNEELLTSHSWKAVRVWAQVGNTQLFYETGNSYSTLKLEFELIHFEKDGTGVYTDNHGVKSPFSWSFTDSAQTKLSLKIQFLPPVTTNWDIITLKKNKLIYIEKYTQGTTSFLSYEERIAK